MRVTTRQRHSRRQNSNYANMGNCESVLINQLLVTVEQLLEGKVLL